MLVNLVSLGNSVLQGMDVLWRSVPIPHLTCSTVAPFPLPLVLNLTWCTIPGQCFQSETQTGSQLGSILTPAFSCSFWFINLSPLVHSCFSRWLCHIFGEHCQGSELSLCLGKTEFLPKVVQITWRVSRGKHIIIILITLLVWVNAVFIKLLRFSDLS